MSWFFDDVIDRLDKLLAGQGELLRLVGQLSTMEAKMAISLAAITAEVTNNTNVTASVVTLVQNLAAQIAAIPQSSDPTTQAALDALTATLTNNDTAIATAVTANTPAAPATANAQGPVKS